ncbi:MAG: thymidylate kinase [Thermoplasmata archaeon]|jgi:dTMP kinase|nr:thymidylate kinase [Thermoplasmata archaeon]
MTDRTYGTRLPRMPEETLVGKLIVVEGADGSGRTTEVNLLREWLEVEGHAVVDTGLRRSDLVSDEIDRAKQGHTLAPTTMALLYAADFADQLENKIIPALAAGSTVLADRYIYTLMARAIVRGASREYARHLYGFAVRPDLIVFLDARPEILLHRSIGKYGSLDYWESGMDLCLSRDLFESFFLYQELLSKEFAWMATDYGFHYVDANRMPEQVHADFQRLVAPLYGARSVAPRRPSRGRPRSVSRVPRRAASA